MNNMDEKPAKGKRERPILFSGPMVRAILAGTKTQTRRIVRLPPWFLEEYPYHGAHEIRAEIESPYGRPGDRLWIREAWRSWDETCVTRGDCADEDHVHSPHCQQKYVAYAATPRVGFRPVPDRACITYLDESTPLDRNVRLLGPWRPSIHMPRWASRIILEVVSVRVERLQDITDADISAEGVTPDVALEMVRLADRRLLATSLQHAWAVGWNAINGKRAPWASNPWVWRVEFRRLP